MRVSYQYLRDGMVHTGIWEGDPSQALSAAAEYLGAEYAPEEEAWVYHAQESGQEILLDEQDLITAGAAILSGASDWYTVWCVGHGTPRR